MANVSQLQPALTPQVKTSSSEATQKDADFLALRLLNKRARLRLSPEPLDVASFPGKSNLFVIVNSRGWFAAVTRDASGASALVFSPLADLRSALAAASAEDDKPYTPRRRVPLDGASPQFLTFACNDAVMLLGLLDGSIHVYSSNQLLSNGDGPAQPLHVFMTSSSAPLLSIQPNPGDIPELVAVLRDCTTSPGSLAVELLDMQKLISAGGWMAGKSPSTTPTAISWSPKGKQLALGLQSGDIVTFSPTATATPKSSIPHPPSARHMSVISVHWLSSSSFHTIYAPLGKLTPEVEQIHFHTSLDSKNNVAQDIKFNSPYLPFPGLCPPGESLVCLRSWDPSKVLLFIGDNTSSDIGLIGSVASDSGESWHNFSLEETSTPSLPLDKDQNDTILLGMDVDLTSSESYHHSTASGETLELPAHPIMYVYASDGTILGWHVLNVTGTSCPGMVAASNMSTSVPDVPSVPSSMVREPSSDMQMTPTISPTTSVPTSATGTPSTVFGQPSTFGAQGSAYTPPGPAFGQTSAFSQVQSAFSQQPPSFGQTPTAFGPTSSPSLFGQSSAPTFGSTPTGCGFGTFSSAGPAKFGQTGFGFGDPPQATPVPPSPSAPEESMAADDAPSFTGLDLGAANSQEADSKPSIFGKPSVSVTSNQQSSDGGLIKPGTGFGAFASSDQKSPFTKASAFSNTQQSSMAFGASPFQVKSENTPSILFGTSSSFGTGQTLFGASTPTFGQPAFGQSSFGQFQTGASTFGKTSLGTISSVPQTTTSINDNVGGAFSSFASSTQSAFSAAVAKSNPSAKPVWTMTDSTKLPESSALGTQTNVFVKPGESPNLKALPTMPTKTADTSSASVFATASAPTVASQFAARDSAARDDDSRSPSPASVQPKTTAASVFSSFTPGPVAGAFSNLQTTPSVFVKPASGIFGELPKDSPFFTPKASESKSVTAFALSMTPGTPTLMPPKANSAPPAFGTPSMPGGTFKGAFPPVAGVPAQTTAVSSGSAFSAFTSAGSGFAAFSSGGNKSFSDLLRSGREDKPSELTQAQSRLPVSTTPASTPVKEPSMPLSVPVELTKVDREEEKVTSEAPAEPKEEATETVLAEEPSLESISSSTSSSFVKVSAEEDGEIEGEPELHDDTESFLSDVPSESEEEEEEEAGDRDDDGDGDGEGGEEDAPSEEAEADSEETEEQGQKEIEPTEVPSTIIPAPARSPSTTPKAEYPKISLSPPPQTPSPSGVLRVSPIRDLGTTPPDSPVKETLAAPVQMPVPTIKTSAPPTSPFILGPRSNNRPARSSPLAGTPLVLEGEGEKSPPASKSAPPIMVMQPPGSQVPHGQGTPVPPSTQRAEMDSTRSMTPPLASLFSAAGEKPAPAIFAPTTTLALPPLFTAADKVVPTTGSPTTTPVPPATVFTPPTSFPSLTPTTITPDPRGMLPKPADGTPPSLKVPQTRFGAQPNPFAAMVGPSMPLSSSPSPFMSPVPSISPSSAPPLVVSAPTPSPTPEQGMQAECLNLLAILSKELENLKQLATVASIKTGELNKTSGVVHQKTDLGDPCKWAFGDVEAFGRVLSDVQADLKTLKLQRVSSRKYLKELDSNMLKVTTRKEEIVRFNKAKSDTEFTKMLKIRTLAPEYSETQSQLRKSVRVIRDRVQKLEDHLQASKKRINEIRTGIPSLRPPSLDTVNRTFRNIDAALDQRKQKVSHLRSRMAKLEISGSVDTRDQLAISSSSKRLLNVTPNVALTTAAALNAERSAQRLKMALLTSRTQPLLNTTAASSAVPRSFQTPQKATAVQQEIKWPDTKAPESALSLPTTPVMSFPRSLPSWTSPSSEFGSPVSYDVTPSRNRGGGKHHQKPIVLKKNASPSSSTQPSPFEWEPVKPVKPVSSLPFALRPAGSS